jgi:cell wall-associated NlpC family hydrolase
MTMKICFNDRAEAMVGYGLQFIGTYYVWGGKELKKDKGYDCSGFVQELLESIGIVSSGINNAMSAQGLYDKLHSHVTGQKVAGFGDLLFFGKSLTGINHVAIALSDKLMLEAGGGSDTLSASGMVRMRPIRKDCVVILPIHELIDQGVRI